MAYVKFCKNCYSNNENMFHGYIAWLKDDCYECPVCKSNLADTEITIEDYKIINAISDDILFLEAMIDLKKKDPIEYQLKMSQFKTQIAQQDQIKQTKKEDNIPKCPTCGSTNLSKISGAKKAAKVGLFGIFGAGDLGKTWKCNNCGSKW